MSLCAIPISDLIFVRTGFAQTRYHRRYSIKTYPRRPKAKVRSAPTTVGTDGPSLVGVPGPYRFAKYCSPNERELWVIGGRGTVYLFSTYLPPRQSTIKSFRPFDGSLHGIYFNSEGFGWVIGSRGAIFHSPDRGNSWIEQSVGGEGELSAVTCVDNKTCWAVGDSGLILRTTDGGNVWTRSVISNLESLNAVDFLDSKNGWVVGNNGLVLRTKDGGVTWDSHQVQLNCEPRCDKWGVSLDSVHFVNERVGWAAASDQIARTEDGGETWKVSPIYQLREQNQVIWFIGLVSHDEKKVWAISESDFNYLSKDGGETWVRMDNDKDARSASLGSLRRRPK